MKINNDYKILGYKILYTLGMISIYRLGIFIPLPGIDSSLILKSMSLTQGSISSMINLFSGGALARGSIFSLNIFPYISASLFMQVGASPIGFEFLHKIKKSGEDGNIKINGYTKYLALIIGFFFSYKYCSELWNLTYNGVKIVYLSKNIFFFLGILHMLTGLMAIIWISNNINNWGIGQGSSLLLYSGILSQIPQFLISIFKNKTYHNLFSENHLLFFFVFFLPLFTLIIIFEYSYKNIKVFNPEIEDFSTEKDKEYDLNLKLNNGSIIPIMMSSTMIIGIQYLYDILVTRNLSHKKLDIVMETLKIGKNNYYILYSVLIIWTTIMYTPIIFDLESVVQQLQKSHNYITNYKPGLETKEFLQSEITHLSILSSGYLIILCVLMDFFIFRMNLLLSITGASLLIIITTSIETYKSIINHITNPEYKKILEKYGLN